MKRGRKRSAVSSMRLGSVPSSSPGMSRTSTVCATPARPRADEEGDAQRHRLLVVPPQQLQARHTVRKALERHPRL